MSEWRLTALAGAYSSFKKVIFLKNILSLRVTCHRKRLENGIFKVKTAYFAEFWRYMDKTA
jgi:hypothetical protein